AAERDGMRGVPRCRRLVGSPASMRPVWAYRLLRHLTVAAREQARRGDRASDHSQLRARRGLVLELRHRAVRRRPAVSAAGASSCRPARPRTAWESPAGLAAPPALEAFAVELLRRRLFLPPGDRVGG